MDSAAESGSADENFTATLYQMDIERIRYSLSRYLRTRLVKIEKYLYSFQDRSKLEKLSFQEQVFATKLLGLTNSQLEMFFKHFENQKDVRAVVESHEDLVNDCQPRMTVSCKHIYLLKFMANINRIHQIMCRISYIARVHQICTISA
jgi:hypothetical protein